MWLGALGSSRTGCSNLVVIILKVESNVGLNVATERERPEAGCTIRALRGEILEFLESVTITFAR